VFKVEEDLVVQEEGLLLSQLIKEQHQHQLEEV
jgi:hypothetical protein